MGWVLRWIGPQRVGFLRPGTIEGYGHDGGLAVRRWSEDPLRVDQGAHIQPGLPRSMLASG